jgi:hypothetical protein
MKSLKIFVILLLISFILFIIFQLDIVKIKEGLVPSYDAPPICEGDISSQPPPCWATVQKDKYNGHVSEFITDDFILKTKIVSPVCPNDPFDDIDDLSGNIPNRTSYDASANRTVSPTTTPMIPTTIPSTTATMTPSTTATMTPSTTATMTPSTTLTSIPSRTTPSINNSTRDASGNNLTRDISGNITNNTYLNTTNNSYYNNQTRSYESSGETNTRTNEDTRTRTNEDTRDSEFQFIQNTTSPYTSIPYSSNDLDAPYEDSALITSAKPTSLYQENQIVTPQKPNIPSPAEIKQMSNQSVIPLGNPPWNQDNTLYNSEPVPLLDDFPTQF